MDSTTDKVVEDWASWMVAAGRSPGTVELRTAHVRRVLRDLGVDDVASVTTSQLVEFLAAQRWKPNTRRSYRASLRVFFEWAQGAGEVDVSPALLVPAPKVPRGRPRPLPEDNYRLALRIAKYDPALRIGIELGGQCGLRRAEIAGVHRDDLTVDLLGDPWLRVIGKGGHERMVPLTGELAARLRARPRDWLFPSPRLPGQPATPQAVGRWISAVLGHGYTTHSLRHRCGTVALERNGGDLRAVQELLGHAKPETTAIYTLIGQDRIRAAMEGAA